MQLIVQVVLMKGEDEVFIPYKYNAEEDQIHGTYHNLGIG